MTGTPNWTRAHESAVRREVLERLSPVHRAIYAIRLWNWLLLFGLCAFVVMLSGPAPDTALLRVTNVVLAPAAVWFVWRECIRSYLWVFVRSARIEYTDAIAAQDLVRRAREAALARFVAADSSIRPGVNEPVRAGIPA